jgi:hypothetical protein
LLALQVTQAWKWALLVHVLSWYMQIHPGHAILEGRKPALLDSLVQVRGKRCQQHCAGCYAACRHMHVPVEAPWWMIQEAAAMCWMPCHAVLADAVAAWFNKGKWQRVGYVHNAMRRKPRSVVGADAVAAALSQATCLRLLQCTYAYFRSKSCIGLFVTMCCC